MANPILKIKYAVDVAAANFRVTDITGAYPTNPEGWGAPQWELANCALFAVVTRQASTGDEQFTPTSVAITYNPAAANADQTAIEFVYSNDGVLSVTMGVLRVSTDGVHYVQDNVVIGPNEYFYWNHNGHVVYQMVSGVPTPSDDLTVLVGVSSVVQTTIVDIIEARLAIIKQGMYKKWRISRDTECDDADSQFQELQKLSQDIQGSIYAFYSSLATQAQSQVETMLDRYSLTNQAIQTQ